MASILVIDKRISDDSKGRREGTASFGISIIGNTSISTSIPPGKDYRDQLLAVITNYIDDSDNYEIRYQYQKTGGTGVNYYIISNASARGNNQIVCVLSDNSGGAMVEVGDVTLKIKVEDARADNGGKEQFSMDVTYPESDDLDNFAYLSNAAEDCTNLNDNAKERGYLAAFKLLARCS